MANAKKESVMGVSGAGAVLDAIARMRRAEREMRRSRASRPRARRVNQADIPDRLPYPCYFLCGDCGWLEDGTVGHPLRRDGDDVVPPGACPSCHARAWVDLRRQSTALAYREAEAMDGRLLDETGRHDGVWLGGLAGITVTASMVMWEPALADFIGLVLTVFFGVWLGTALLVNRVVRSIRPQVRPRRWRRPLPPASLPSARASRGLLTGDATMHAPLSHEPCLGWAVQVFNDEGLLLDEQHHAVLSIDGEVLAADSLALDLTTHELRPSPGDETFVQFMHRRGLSPHDASLRVFAACLVPGVEVALEPRGAAHGGSVLREVSPALVARAA